MRFRQARPDIRFIIHQVRLWQVMPGTMRRLQGLQERLGPCRAVLGKLFCWKLLQEVQGQQHYPAACRWRKCVDLDVAITCRERCHDPWVRRCRKICTSYPATVTGHVGCDLFGNFTGIEIIRSSCCQPPECVCQDGLAHQVTLGWHVSILHDNKGDDCR